MLRFALLAVQLTAPHANVQSALPMHRDPIVAAQLISDRTSPFNNRQVSPIAPEARSAQPALGPTMCVCTMEYDPVCARLANGYEMTFPNACHAGCAGATVVHRGPC